MQSLGADPSSERHVLILKRRVGESLLIGRDIVVMVVGIRGSQVRIGIEAPRATAVHRKELYDRLRPAVPVAPRSARGSLSSGSRLR
jgi:carbon storage regulator